MLVRYKLLFILFLVVGLNACKKDECIEGSSNLKDRVLTVNPISTVIHNTDAFNLKISQGPTQEIRITGPENLLDNVRSAVENGVWTVGLKEGEYCTDVVGQFDVELVVTNIERIQNNGAAQIIVGALNADSNLYIENNGTGNITLNDLDGYYVELKLNANGHIIAKGDATYVDYLLNGKGNIDAFELETFDGYARNKNQSNINLFVTSDLNAFIDASGNICYKGNPNISPVINGTGSIIDKN